MQTAQQSIMVTGGGGFLGHHVCGLLIDAGYAVRNLDFVPSRHASPHLTNWTGSFLDHGLAREALAGCDAVIHLAATGFIAEANRNPGRDAEENIIGTLRLLDFMCDADVGRFVFCSSGGTVYGPTTRLPIDEDHPTFPISAYGISKLALEKYVRLYDAASPSGVGNGRLRTVTLRVANPYGPHQNIRKGQGALTTFCHMATKGEPITIWGDGSVERDYIHVTDVARAVLAAIDHPDVSGTEINIGSGTGTSLRQLVQAIESALGHNIAVSYTEGRGFDVQSNWLDIRRAKTLIGWEPKVGLTDGIAQLLEHLRSDSV